MGEGSPEVHFEQWKEGFLDIRLILKGGGCENVGAQYSFPATLNEKKCGRDLEGVKNCVIDAVQKAQGQGCGPGFLGICVGGSRASGLEFAKRQFLRELDDENPIPELANLEKEIVEKCNKLGIGPMGFGGKRTINSCKVGSLNRLPASFFVSISYMCWAFRRRGFLLNQDGEIKNWLYENERDILAKNQNEEIFFKNSDVKILKTPISEQDVRSLKVGDVVMLSGTIFTARDAVHKYLCDGNEIDILRNGVIYHCGPVVVKKNGEYKVLAAGPTASIREEVYESEIIEKYGIKAVIGKGGMGEKTLEALQKFGAVYLHAIGGAAQVYARCVKKVKNVHLLEEFGSPEAVWELEVENFMVVVTMDSGGRSLHDQILALSQSPIS